MLKILELDEQDTIGFCVDGSIDGQDIDRVIGHLEERVSNGDRLKILGEIKNFGPTGMTAEALKKDILFWIRNPGIIPKIAKAALVTDQKWMSKMFDVECALIPTLEGETFELDRRDEALEWLRTDQREAKRLDITLSELAENNVLRTTTGFALGWLTADLVRKPNRRKVGFLLLGGAVAASLPFGVRFYNNNRKVLSA
ncbi:MAG: STAS/SEC14 domain-containing protein [Pyrinomonadaceae bacterium]